MSHSDFISKNSFIDKNITCGIHPQKIEDISYEQSPRGYLIELIKNSENFQEKHEFSSYPVEQTPILEHVESQCSLTIEKKEKSLSKFEDFKNFTNNLNSEASTTLFNPFSFIPYLKESQSHSHCQSSASATIRHKQTSAIEKNGHLFQKKSPTSILILSHSTSKSFIEDEFDSASEKELNSNNYNNSKKNIKDNQYMTPSVVSTRSTSDTVSISSPERYFQDFSEKIKNNVMSENISAEKIINTEAEISREENIMNVSRKNEFISNFSNQKREREIQEDKCMATTSRINREEEIFIIEKNFLKRKRKNKFQKVMDLLKDSVLSHSYVKDSIMQNIKDSMTIYSQEEYMMDMENIKNDEGHCIMKKNFPNAYTRANFYKSFKFVEKRRKENKKKIFLQDDKLKTNYNPISGKKDEKNYFLFNREDLSQAKFLPKKMWSPCVSKDPKEFLNRMSSIWPHNKLFFSEEFLLEYLLCFNNDYELVYENVLSESAHFRNFLSYKKNDEINKFDMAIQEKELTLNLKGENISNRHYYLRKR